VKKQFIALIFLLVYSITVFADYKADYQKLLKDNQTEKLASLLARWEKVEPNNPELYIGYFNYHLSKAMKSGASIDTIIPKDNRQSYMILTDPKTGKVAGYLHDEIFYDEDETQKALEYLNRGLAFGQDRLDMYFGKIHVLMDIHNYKGAYDELSFILDHGKAINSQWLWSDNKKIDNGMYFLLENIQDYYNTWFNEDTVETNSYVDQLSRKQVALYPNHSWAYSNLFVTIKRLNINEDEFYLVKKAYDIDPKDMVNVNNLANYYKTHNNKSEAIKLYKIMAVSNDINVSEDAKKNLKELEK